MFKKYPDSCKVCYKSWVDITLLQNFFVLLKNDFSNFKIYISFAFLKYHCLHMTICSIAEKFTRQIFDEQKSSQWIESPQMERHSSDRPFIIKGHGKIIVHRLGQESQDSRNLSKMPNGQGKISIWITWDIGHEFQQRILYDQTNTFRKCDNTYY